MSLNFSALRVSEDLLVKGLPKNLIQHSRNIFAKAALGGAYRHDRPANDCLSQIMRVFVVFLIRYILWFFVSDNYNIGICCFNMAS